MNPADMQKLVEQTKQMQAKMADLQRELAAKRFEASAGGGMITAVASGALRILEVRIEPGVFEQGDRGMIEDLTAAAVNAALSQAQQWAQEQFQKLSMGSIGMAMPGMPDSGS
jgi:DNA-binding YbaB/EbfC family protein